MTVVKIGSEVAPPRSRKSDLAFSAKAARNRAPRGKPAEQPQAKPADKGHNGSGNHEQPHNGTPALNARKMREKAASASCRLSLRACEKMGTGSAALCVPTRENRANARCLSPFFTSSELRVFFARRKATLPLMRPFRDTAAAAPRGGAESPAFGHHSQGPDVLVLEPPRSSPERWISRAWNIASPKPGSERPSFPLIELIAEPARKRIDSVNWRSSASSRLSRMLP